MGKVVRGRSQKSGRKVSNYRVHYGRYPVGYVKGSSDRIARKRAIKSCEKQACGFEPGKVKIEKI